MGEMSAGTTAHILTLLALVEASAGQTEHAERAALYLAAADAQRERLKQPVTHAYAQEYSTSLASVKELLGEERWRTAREKGRAMSLDEVVMIALQTTDA